MNVAFKTPPELEKVERDFKTTSECENSGTLHLNHLANRGTRLLKLLSAVQLGQSVASVNSYAGPEEIKASENSGIFAETRLFLIQSFHFPDMQPILNFL